MDKRLLSITFSLLLILSVFAAAPVTAQDSQETEQKEEHTKYIVDHNTETGVSTVQLEVKLTEDSKYADWSLSWGIPESAEITKASTTHSDSVKTERNGSEIKFIEDDGPARNTETFYVTYETTDFFQTTDQFNITQHEAGLSALPDKPSYLEINFEGEEIANAVRYTNHSLKVDDNKVIADGEGPITLYINTKKEEEVVETDDFAVYGKELAKDDLDNAYAISTIATGVIPQYKQVPVIVLSEDRYDQEVSDVSDGQFRGGIIYLSEETTEEGRLLPILTHEYTHAVTQRMEPTSPATWFTEGASQYTEAIARDKVDRLQNDIDEDRFWQYHSNDESWVEGSWDSFDKEEREFGYAYSELLFKNKVQESGSPTYVHDLYRSMVTDEVNITEDTTPAVLYGDSWDGKVCSESTKSETLDCADDTMEYVPELVKPDEYTTPFDGTTQEQDIDYVQVDDSSSSSDSDSSDTGNKILDILREMFQDFITNDLVETFIEHINELLRNLLKSEA